MTAKAVGKNSNFCVSVKTNFQQFFAFKYRFLRLSLNENWTSLRVSFIWFPVFGNFRFSKWTVTCTLDFCIFNLRQLPGALFILVYSLRSNISLRLISYYKTAGERAKVATNLTQSKYDWSQSNWLVNFFCLLYLQLSSSFHRAVIFSSRGEEITRFPRF